MRKKVIWIIIALIIVAAAVAAWKVYSEYRIWTTPWGADSDEFTIQIDEGKTAQQIAGQLVEKGVLHHSRMFLIMADLRGLGVKLKAGEYRIQGEQSPYEILDMLATGKQYYRSLVIPEGFTQLDIAKRCEEAKICSAEDFMEQCRKMDMFKFVIAEPPNGANGALEGVLFPDTYYLFKNTPAVKVLDRMMKKFESVSQKLYEEAKKKADEKGTPNWWVGENLSYAAQIHRVLVLASIIEKEAKKPEDRPLIASVFLNRIKKNMPLQSDSTVHYAINDWTRPLTSEDMKVDSAYNTYLNPGLPPAAICNPGEDCLRAAMMPADTTYLYFIAMSDGETKFTGSYNEFLQWKNQLKQERRTSKAEN